MASERTPLKTVAALVLAGLLLSPAARAAPTPADRETARHLMKIGDEKLAANDFRAALRAYESAHAIMAVSSTGLAVARARIGLGELIEARDLLLEVVRAPRAADEPEPLLQAREEAAALAKKLEGRIPSIVISVKGPPPEASVEVSVNGHVVPVVSMNATRRVNPGTHVLTAASDGFAPTNSKVSLKEGESQKVALKLSPGEPRDGGFERGGASGASAYALYREGFHIGVGAGPMMLLPFGVGGGVDFGGTAGMVLNVGISPRVDLRLGAFAAMHAGVYSYLHVGAPLTVRVNINSRFVMSAGLSAGFGNNISWNQSGFVGGPEWSLLGLRLGDRREIELDFVQGFRFGEMPTEYHNGFTLTYLFLDDDDDIKCR